MWRWKETAGESDLLLKPPCLRGWLEETHVVLMLDKGKLPLHFLRVSLFIPLCLINKYP